jgi:hypothetical protein
VNKLLLVLVLLFAPRLAHAEQVGVVVTGEATMQPQLVKSLETWLKSQGHELVGSPLPPDAINTLVDCFVIEDEGCARGVIEKRAKSKVVVFARVDVQAGGDLDKTVTLTAYWFEKGEKAVSARKFCERCTDATLTTTANDLLVSLAKAAPHPTGKVKVTSTPAGASCEIDGKPVGSTPIDQDITPGPHEIIVVRERHETEKRSVTVTAGETTTVDVALVEKRASGGKRLYPAIAMGVGGALIATGVVMVLIDEDEAPDKPMFIRNTGPSGAGIAIGGLAVAAGGYLWYRMTGKRESAPVAAIGHDSTYVGWQGRF